MPPSHSRHLLSVSQFRARLDSTAADLPSMVAGYGPCDSSGSAVPSGGPTCHRRNALAPLKHTCPVAGHNRQRAFHRRKAMAPTLADTGKRDMPGSRCRRCQASPGGGCGL